GRKKWYVARGGAFLGLLAAVFLIVGIALAGYAASRWRHGSPRWSDVVVAAIGACLIVDGVVLIVSAKYASVWRRRTKAGQTEAERWDAFRRYLTDFPRLQEAPPATLELWERYLVYG